MSCARGRTGIAGIGSIFTKEYLLEEQTKKHSSDEAFEPKLLFEVSTPGVPSR
jgi:hypothetical protein